MFHGHELFHEIVNDHELFHDIVHETVHDHATFHAIVHDIVHGHETFHELFHGHDMCNEPDYYVFMVMICFMKYVMTMTYSMIYCMICVMVMT